MCKPKVDNSIQIQQQREAEEARKREEERQARIKAGTTAINDNFSLFDDAFFDTRRQTYLDYYQPQLDEQFTKAQQDLTFALARTGNLNSTAAADKQSELLKKYDAERGSLLSQAEADVASAQSQIANEKSALVSQLNATGDSDQISNEALSRSQQLFQAKPSYNSLGDIFSGITSAIGNYSAGNKAGQQYNAYFGNNNARASSPTTTVR